MTQYNNNTIQMSVEYQLCFTYMHCLSRVQERTIVPQINRKMSWVFFLLPHFHLIYNAYPSVAIIYYVYTMHVLVLL